MNHDARGSGTNLTDLSSYLAMGGHGVYVWSSYAVAAIGLSVLLAATLAGLRRREAELRRLENAAGERP